MAHGPKNVPWFPFPQQGAAKSMMVFSYGAIVKAHELRATFWWLAQIRQLG
jgi:hypothetical protein